MSIILMFSYKRSIILTTKYLGKALGAHPRRVLHKSRQTSEREASILNTIPHRISLINIQRKRNPKKNEPPHLCTTVASKYLTTVTPSPGLHPMYSQKLVSTSPHKPAMASSQQNHPAFPTRPFGSSKLPDRGTSTGFGASSHATAARENAARLERERAAQQQQQQVTGPGSSNAMAQLTDEQRDEINEAVCVSLSPFLLMSVPFPESVSVIILTMWKFKSKSMIPR